MGENILSVIRTGIDQPGERWSYNVYNPRTTEIDQPGMRAT